MIYTGEKTLYSQLENTRRILEETLGSDMANELVRILLTSKLTDTQALDIANTILRNLESLKAFSNEELKELVRKVAEYVKKGDTAEEALKKAMKEYKDILSLEIAIVAFSKVISDPELATEVMKLLRHIKDTAGSGAAAWLLEFFGRNYLRDAYSKGTAYAEARLRETIEKDLKYGESLKQNCVIASSIVRLLMMVEELRNRINRGEPERGLSKLIGDIGEEYVKLYLQNEIKRSISKLLGIPEDELEIVGPFEKGPDFNVYHKNKLVEQNR